MAELHPIQQLSIWILPILFAVTLHEAAHGLAAFYLGDATAKQQGRLTLNPIPHIDLLGTIILPGLLVLLGGVIFGWAKPVPVDNRNLRKPRRDMALVAAAGPAANVCMAVFWALVLKTGYHAEMEFVKLLGEAGVVINLVLIALNMLPILPLDGGRILHSLLPASWGAVYARSEPYGLLILLGLVLTGLLGHILRPLLQLGWNMIVHLLI